MGELRQTGPLKFGPGQMQKGPSFAIQTRAGHTRGIDQRRSMAMAQKVLTDPGATLKGMVHVPKDHQISSSMPGHTIQGEGQILIPPVDGWRLPIPTTGTGRI